jgi:hypothetical protein
MAVRTSFLYNSADIYHTGTESAPRHTFARLDGRLLFASASRTGKTHRRSPGHRHNIAGSQTCIKANIIACNLKDMMTVITFMLHAYPAAVKR